MRVLFPDTKSCADVRARVHLPAEIPEAWQPAVTRWTEHNGSARTRTAQDVSGRGPDRQGSW
jgi:maltooligosyltrehalose synthase